jgi:hypothetical protein
MAGLHMKAIYDRLRGAAPQDVAVTTHDLWKPGSGHSFSGAERTEAADAYVDFFDAIKLYIHPSHTLTEIRCYDGYNGDGTPGEVDYIHDANVTGTSVNDALPPQCAFAITEVTDARRHWGRFYIPGMSENYSDATGSFSSAMQATIQGAAKTLYDRWNAIADCNAVVWGTVTAEAQYNSPLAPTRPFPSWLFPDPPVTTLSTGAWAVQQLRTDELVDIIRRRRWQSVLNKTTVNLAA